MAIVGKILLGILLFILILLLFILFLPICYRVKGKIDAEGKTLNAKVSWFFGLIRFRFDYPEPARPILKLAFFTLMGKEEPESNEKPEESEKLEGSGKPEEPGREEKPENAKEPLAEAEQQEESRGEPEKAEESVESQAESSEVAHASEEVNDEAEFPKAEKKKAKKPLKQKKSKEEKASAKARSKEKIQKILDDVKYYKSLWEEKDTQPFVKDALARVLHVLKNLMPKKIRGRILFGAASPDVTGYVYGIFCVLKTMYPKRFSLEVTPDFERKVLEGDVLIKGRFMVFTLLIDALRIFFDKRFRRLREKIDLRKHPEKAKELARSRKRKRRKVKK